MPKKRLSVDLPDPRPAHVVAGRPRWAASRRGDYVARLLTPGALEAGWSRVLANHGGPGDDGETVADFARRAGAALDQLRHDLRCEHYRPGPARVVRIPKNAGGVRVLRIPCVVDRVAQAAAHAVLSEGLEPEFEAWSFGYRPGRSAGQAVDLARRYLGAGLDHVVDADIENFFDTVPHDRMLAKLDAATADAALVRLVALWLAGDGGPLACDAGLPQGAPISPILANLYLDDLDEAFARQGARMVRFADDFLIFLGSRGAAQAALRDLAAFLAEEGLRLNPEKTRLVAPGQVMGFLGAVVGRAVADPARPPLARLGEPVAEPAADPMGAPAPSSPAGPLYLMTPGRSMARRHDSFVIVEDGAEGPRVHARLVHRIEIGPGCGVDVEALRLAAERDIPLALVNGAGLPELRLVAARDRHGARQLAQARACLDPARAGALSAALVLAQVNGRKQVLYDIKGVLAKSGDPRAETVRRAARNLTRLARLLRRAPPVAMVSKIEARAAQIYWPAFGAGLQGGFTLHTRERREGRNPASLLLDFGAALLLRDVEAAVRSAGLHPGFGVLHVSADDGQPCVWDLAEPFRPPVAEASVRLAIGSGAVRLKDFERSGDRLRLLPSGREGFVRAYERTAGLLNRDHRTGERVSWRERMRRDALAFVRAVEDGAPFIASERR